MDLKGSAEEIDLIVTTLVGPDFLKTDNVGFRGAKSGDDRLVPPFVFTESVAEIPRCDSNDHGSIVEGQGA